MQDLKFAYGKGYISINEDAKVKITETGDSWRMQWLDYRPEDCPILVLPDNQYCIKSTGEVRDREQKAVSRADNLYYVRKSMSRMRDYISTNITSDTISNTVWVTFTYADNMTDDKKLMDDWRNFNRFYRQVVGNYEYIAVAEPQSRGAWHLHVFLIFDSQPYIDYDLIRNTWGKGRVEVQYIRGDIDNLGAYLSAYLSNIDLQEIAKNNNNTHDLNIIDRLQTDGNTKSFIKGMRLAMYPPNFKLCRCSRKIKKPREYLTDIKTAKEKIGDTSPDYEKVAEIADETHNYYNLVYTAYYNTKSDKNQDII